MVQNWAEHHASVTVNAPLHQVYSLFSHFNDFPKFMSFVKEVTYYDDQRSHWVADVVGRHEWDAVNENWVENQQIGWRSYNGFENNGKVTFQTVGPMQTLVDVYLSYNPPAGVLGDVGEKLGAGSRFEKALQQDLDNFARMVDQAPTGPWIPNHLAISSIVAVRLLRERLLTVKMLAWGTNLIHVPVPQRQVTTLPPPALLWTVPYWTRTL